MSLFKIFFLAPLPSFRAACFARVGGNRPCSIYQICTSLAVTGVTRACLSRDTYIYATTTPISSTTFLDLFLFCIKYLKPSRVNILSTVNS